MRAGEAAHASPPPSSPHRRQYLEHWEPAIDAHIDDARRQLQTQAGAWAGRSAGALQAAAFLGLGKLTDVLGSLARQQQQQEQQLSRPQSGPAAPLPQPVGVPAARHEL